jgi:CheY-like chemotaxis protein
MNHTKPYSDTTLYDQAEGSFTVLEYSQYTSASRTSIAPVVNLGAEEHMPSGETGVSKAVVTESKENTDNQDALRTTAETNEAPVRQTRSPLVLIIEDSTELAEVIEATLQRLNMTTIHETHGNKAYNRFRQMKPDVVLLDIGLPDMTGWKLLENIKEKNPEAAMPKIVVITAYGDPANRLIGKLQNVHDYLIKPFSAEDVEKVVLSALSSASR